MNKKRILLIILVIVVLVAALFVWRLFRGGEPAPTSSSSVPGVARTVYREPTGEADQLLEQLRNLETITLDTAVLESAAFRALIDFGRPLTRVAPGRANPFSPINPFEDPSTRSGSGTSSAPTTSR